MHGSPHHVSLLDTGGDVLPDRLAVSSNLVYWTRGDASLNRDYPGGRPAGRPART